MSLSHPGLTKLSLAGCAMDSEVAAHVLGSQVHVHVQSSGIPSHSNCIQRRLGPERSTMCSSMPASSWSCLEGSFFVFQMGNSSF